MALLGALELCGLREAGRPTVSPPPYIDTDPGAFDEKPASAVASARRVAAAAARHPNDKFTPEVSALMTEIQNTQDMVVASQADQMHARDLQRAVAAGIKAAVADPEMWAAAMKAMQNKAQSEAGGWLLGGVKTALSKVAWIVAIGLGVYLVGGWGALVSLIKGSAAN